MIYGRIFKITCPAGKVYIGRTTYKLTEIKRFFESSVRWKKRLYPIHEAIIKHGTVLKWEFVDKAKDKRELDKKVKHWIVKLQSAVPEYGYNRTWGGFNAIPTLESCLNMSKAQRGKVLSETHRLNMCRAVALAMGGMAENKVREIRAYLADGGSLTGTARRFEIGRSTVADIKARRRYAWVV